MLKDEDLPHPWKIEKRTLGTENGWALDRALDITKELKDEDIETGTTTSGLTIQLPKRGHDDARHVMGSAWSVIVNQDTNDRVMLRTQTLEQGAVISGVIFLPHHPDESIRGTVLRSLPISTIEENVNIREWENKSHWLIAFSTQINPLKPLGNPKSTPDFHKHAAFQFITFKQRGEDPVTAMAEVNDVSEKTVQGWLTQARKMRLLPPSRPGKRG